MWVCTSGICTVTILITDMVLDQRPFFLGILIRAPFPLLIFSSLLQVAWIGSTQINRFMHQHTGTRLGMHLSSHG